MTRFWSETEAVASVDGLTVTRLRVLVETRCVRPLRGDGGPVFGEAELARLRLACELAEDFELDDEAAAMVLSLLDQIHGLRRELRGLAAAVAAEPDEVRDRIRSRVAASAGRAEN